MMKEKYISSQKASKLCGQLEDGDGLPPHVYERVGNRRKHSRNALPKTYQLCKQVFRTLNFALMELEDGLEGVQVMKVEPAPDSTHLLIIVGGENFSVEKQNQVLRELNRQMGVLRQEIAKGIHRKKVPELTFRFLPMASGTGEKDSE